MKNILLTTMLLGTLSATAQSTHPAGVTGCIADWTFYTQGTSTTLQDMSGNGHNGVATSLNSVAGYRNRSIEAMNFNGTSSFVQVPTHTQLNPTAISIVALLKFKGFYAGSCQGNNIIYKSVSYFQQGCWAMSVDDQTYDANCAVFSPANMQMNYMSSTTTQPPVPAGNYLSLNQWYLLVTTYDGDSMKRYQIPLDTVNWLTSVAPISKAKIGMAIGSNTSDVMIGATQNTSYPYWFNGDMDNLSLFNKSLHDTDVLNIYKYFRGPRPAPATVHNTNANANEFLAVRSGSIQIQNPGAGKAFSYSLFDLSGRKLSEGTSIENSIHVDTRVHASQMLLVRLQNDAGQWTGKIVTY